MKNLTITFLLVSIVAMQAWTPSPSGEGRGEVALGLSIGDYAPDFKLKNVDGKMVALADYKEAKGFVMVFTCNHCPYAKLYEDRIIELDKTLKTKGYPVIAINPNDVSKYPDDSFDNMKKRAKEKGFTFPYLIDESQETARNYGAARTPHAFLLKHESAGKYKLMYAGAIDDDTEGVKEWREKYVELAIEAIEKGEPVNPTITKAVGCTIKWKS